MHPLFADFRRLLAYLGLLLIAGSMLAVSAAFAGIADWVSAFAFCLPLTAFLGMILLSEYSFCVKWRGGRNPVLWGVLRTAGRALALGIVTHGMADVWSTLLDWASASQLRFSIDRSLGAALFMAGVFLSLLSMLAHELYRTMEAMHTAERRATASQLHAREAELRMLRSQINPHFLFNSLNSISALTSVDPAGAREMTIALAQFFRRTLAVAERQSIALDEELGLIEDYLAVEKVRFGERLQTTLEADKTARAAQIPPLLLQPLIENAIKHGIRDRVAGGKIDLRAAARAGWLHLTVENPMGERKNPSAGTGLGLKNIQSRLASVYGDRARINWKESAENFRVELTLPYEGEET